MESGPISDVAEQDEPKEKRDVQGDVGHPSHFSGQVSLARSADQHLLTVEAGAVQPARGPDTLVVFCASQVAKTERNPWGSPESGCHCVRLPALDIIDDGEQFSWLRGGLGWLWPQEANQREAEFAKTGASAVCNIFATGPAELNVGGEFFGALVKWTWRGLSLGR